MNRFIFAIVLALGAGGIAGAASASDDTDSICLLELDDVAHAQEAGPPAALDVTVRAHASHPMSDATAPAELGDDLAIDAVSGATPLGMPIERATMALSMPAENHDDLPIHSRPRPYRKAIDEQVRSNANLIEPGAARTPRRSLE